VDRLETDSSLVLRKIMLSACSMDVPVGLLTMYEWVKRSIIQNAQTDIRRFRLAIGMKEEDCPDMVTFFERAEANGIVNAVFVDEIEDLLRRIEQSHLLKNVLEPYKMAVNRFHYKRRYLIRECQICIYEREMVYILPCRHSGMCRNCAYSHRYTPRCPHCRGGVTDVIYIEEDDIPTDIYI
jgi:hypothetical protein